MNTFRAVVVVSAVIVLTGLTGCSGDNGSSASAPSGAALRPAATATPADPALAGLVGSGCGDYAAAEPSGPGSIAGMTEDPLATATSHNPLLSTFSTIISGRLNKKVKLSDTLNGNEFTVFAPVNSAFAKLPATTMAQLKLSRNSRRLTNLLTYHVVVGRLSPVKVVGIQLTVDGGSLKVTRSGNLMKVNGATVICGGLQTANATLYLLDTVLTPTSD